VPIDPSNFAEIGFAGLSAVLLFGVFRWMTGELNKKIDDLHQIIIKLIDSKNALKDSINEDITELMKSISHLDDETTNHLNYIEWRESVRSDLTYVKSDVGWIKENLRNIQHRQGTIEKQISWFKGFFAIVVVLFGSSISWIINIMR
jgi:chromosome segregation ATPase